MSDKQKLAQVFHFDLYGKREEKYDFLNENSIETIDWNLLETTAPNFFFVNKNFDGKDDYEKGFSIGILFQVNVTGIKTHDDGNLVSFEEFSENNFKYDYRPFDIRFINYDLKKVVRPRFSVMKHMCKDNLSLIVPRQAVTDNWNHVQVSKYLSDNRIHYSNKGIPIVCPLYLYPETNAQQTTDETVERTPNLNAEIVQQIAEKIGLKFTNEKEQHVISNEAVIARNEAISTNKTDGFVPRHDDSDTFAPIDILDYIYAVLHSPTYREKYKEFLKIDFPRVPYPKDLPSFKNLVSLGAELRQIHLLESAVVNKPITKYPIAGDNVVEKIRFETNVGEVQNLADVKTGTVYINATQYFDNVPEVAWNFYIGGYQPAQKWLKDRKGRTLEFDDILHYQKIIVALSETNRIMQEIDKIEIE